MEKVTVKPNQRVEEVFDLFKKYKEKTIVPLPYSIPDQGPIGEFFGYMNQHSMSPAYLHLMFEAEGHETLITQIFFEGDEWLETDVVDGVRPEPMTKLEFRR